MAKGIKSIRAWAVARVRSLAPTEWPDKRFQCIDDGTTRRPRLEDWDQTRGFEIGYVDDRLPIPRQDLGPCGRTGHYMVVELAVRVRYPARGRRHEVLDAAGSDASLIGGALLDPFEWDFTNTGIYDVEVIEPDEPVDVRATETDDDPTAASHEADVIGRIYSTNVRIHYEED